MAKTKESLQRRASGIAHTVIFKIRLTVLVNMLWFLFLVVWLFFFAENFSLYKNIGIFLISIMVSMLLNVYIWLLGSKV